LFVLIVNRAVIGFALIINNICFGGFYNGAIFNPVFVIGKPNAVPTSSITVLNGRPVD
jgi:hypothetical protein